MAAGTANPIVASPFEINNCSDSTAGQNGRIDKKWAPASTVAIVPGGALSTTAFTSSSGPNPPASLHRIWWKQLTVLGSTMGTKKDFEGAYELVRSGRARPVVDEVLPLREIRAAHERLEAGEQLGKIVLRIPE